MNVSKERLDADALGPGTHRGFANDPGGRRVLVRWARAHGCELDADQQRAEIVNDLDDLETAYQGLVKDHIAARERTATATLALIRRQLDARIGVEPALARRRPRPPVPRARSGTPLDDAQLFEVPGQARHVEGRHS